MFLTTKAALLAATVLFTPAGLSGGPVAHTDAPEHCTTPEVITKVYTEHKVTVVRIEGDKLAAFNRAYEAKFNQPAPTDVSTILIAEQGPKAQVLSFNKDNCLQGVGNAATEVIHELLGG